MDHVNLHIRNMQKASSDMLELKSRLDSALLCILSTRQDIEIAKIGPGVNPKLNDIIKTLNQELDRNGWLSNTNK